MARNSGETLYDRAIDPCQYDKAEVGWVAQGKGVQSPTRAHFLEYLSPLVKAWQGQDLLDIGTGTAWFPDLASRVGLKSVVGLEPSARNVELASQLYPGVEVVQTTLTAFKSPQRFGVITALMSLPHIANLDDFFARVANFLTISGEFIAIVPDYDHHKTERHGYKLEFQELNDDAYVVEATRPHGTIVDLVRRVEVYRRAALRGDLILVKDTPMIATHLLRFWPTPRVVACCKDVI